MQASIRCKEGCWPQVRPWLPLPHSWDAKQIPSWNKIIKVPLSRQKVSIETVERYNNVDDSLSSWSDSRANELPHKKSWRLWLKRFQNKREVKDFKRHSSSSESSKDKYDSCSESESGIEACSMHKQYACLRRGQDCRTDIYSSIGRHERGICSFPKELLFIRQVYGHSQELLDCTTYCFADESSNYDDKVSKSVSIGVKHILVIWTPKYTIHSTQFWKSVFFQPSRWCVVRINYTTVPHYLCHTFLWSSPPPLHWALELRNDVNHFKRQEEAVVISYCKAICNSVLVKNWRKLKAIILKAFNRFTGSIMYNTRSKSWTFSV